MIPQESLCTATPIMYIYKVSLCISIMYAKALSLSFRPPTLHPFFRKPSGSQYWCHAPNRLRCAGKHEELHELESKLLKGGYVGDDIGDHYGAY